MANNQYVNKIIYGDQTLIDLTSDTVAANKMLSGYTAHDKSGAAITGTIVSRSSSDVIDSIEVNNNKTYFVHTYPAGYYPNQFSFGTHVQLIPVPSSGVYNFNVMVPNGTANPDLSEPGDWLTITFEVDSSGNSNVDVADLPAATGVSF